MQRNPAIIVIGYNRPESLERLLISLVHADYEGENITLVISLDACEDVVLSRAVREVADGCIWDRGDKRVIVKDRNLGLRDHVLECGDLSKIYGSIIVLEDDLIVSKSFYLFGLQALEFFKADRRIAGISLYTYHRNRCEGELFYPLIDRSDNFFLQMASSWGQIWTHEQWKDFREWFKNNEQVTDEDLLPQHVISWPDTSWAKYFNKYLVIKNKTFVYPRTSLTTNFSEKGVHYSKKTNVEQVPLVQDKPRYIFGTFDKSYAVYDAFFEISSKILKEKFGIFDEYDYEVDLYGLKDKRKIKKDYVLTRNAKGVGISSFAGDMVPPELNIIHNIKGNAFSFIKVENMNDKVGCEQKEPQDLYEQFSNTYSAKVAVYFAIRKIAETFFSKLKKSTGIC